jgi:hypothetical protein
MSCHLTQLRASLITICALLFTLLVTSSTSGRNSSLYPTPGSSQKIIPAATIAGNTHISAIIANDGSADTDFTAAAGLPSQQRQANVVLTPADGPPGTVTTADGTGFTPNHPVTVTQSGGLIVTVDSISIRADQSGSITISFRIRDQAPPGAIIVTFMQEDNTATAQFRVRRTSSGIGGAPTQPIKGTVDEFTQWLNACVNGRLNIPMCTTGG